MGDYAAWHTGVEFDRDSRTWRGYIEDNEYTEKHLTDATFADKEDAAVAASDMLTQVREGTPPGEAKTAGLPRL